MLSISVFEAKNRLSELLSLVESGKEFEITRRGIPIARLIAAQAHSQSQAQQVLAELRAKFVLDDFAPGEDLKSISREGLC